MIGNAGAYEISGNQVTIRPVVAKIPVVMKPGAFEVYEFKIEGNTLTLTQRRNVRGPVEQGTVWPAERASPAADTGLSDIKRFWAAPCTPSR
jgi:hypothetical protein